jgi:hypothetical protein
VLGFLYKKGFHPKRLDVQEKVWKAEEAAASEARRTAEVLKTLEAERNEEDLSRAAGGAITCASGLEWMYSGARAAVPSKEEAARASEDYLLGKRAVGATAAAPGKAATVSHSDFDIVKVNDARMAAITSGGVARGGTGGAVGAAAGRVRVVAPQFEAAAIAREDPLARFADKRAGGGGGGGYH